MKEPSYYELPIDQRYDYLDYLKTHPSITPEEFKAQGLTYAMPEYDFKLLAADLIAENPGASMKTMIGLGMQLLHGHIAPMPLSIALEALGAK